MIDIVPNAERTAAIRQLNDTLRRTGEGGRTVLTRGVAALPTDELTMALRAVAGFDAFREANDPYAEHDCAVLSVAGHQVMWKIDYFDPELEHHSLDPSDPSITTRVLTIMLAEEY